MYVRTAAIVFRTGPDHWQLQRMPSAAGEKLFLSGKTVPGLCKMLRRLSRTDGGRSSVFVQMASFRKVLRLFALRYGNRLVAAGAWRQGIYQLAQAFDRLLRWAWALWHLCIMSQEAVEVMQKRCFGEGSALRNPVDINFLIIYN